MKGQIQICFKAELEPGVGVGHRSFPAQAVLWDKV